jgi:hypothetical protein
MYPLGWCCIDADQSGICGRLAFLWDRWLIETLKTSTRACTIFHRCSISFELDHFVFLATIAFLLLKLQSAALRDRTKIQAVQLERGKDECSRTATAATFVQFL